MNRKFFIFIFSLIMAPLQTIFCERLTPIARGFEKPVHAVINSEGLFAVEQPGRIKLDGKTILDLTNEVVSGGEMGLLSIAFDEAFNRGADGFMYMNYTAGDPLETRIVSYPVKRRPLRILTEKKRVILSFRQPYRNHNGGLLIFRPDGTLFIGAGDGGSAGDPHGNGQNRKSLLGKILRIKPTPEQESPYQIPGDNPFKNDPSFRPEVYAYGMRNPWRFSFDRLTGALIVADVGQDRQEEIDIVRAGSNAGWNTMEGDLCFNPKTNCNRSGLTPPIFTYGRNDGVSITGGYVYRGNKIPSLRGSYVFADFGSGWIRAFAVSATAKTGPLRTIIPKLGPISSFAEDQSGELYAMSYFEGTIYRLDP